MMKTLSLDDLTRLIHNVRWDGLYHGEYYKMFMEHRNGFLFLVVVGKVLQPVPKEMSAHIKRVLDKMPQAKVVIDLTRCDYLSSPSLGFLVEFLKMTTAATARTVMLKPNEPLRTIISLLGINQLFTMVASEQDAYDTLNAG